MVAIRTYQPQRDALGVYSLWQLTLSHLWPLPYETFHTVTVANPAYRPGDHVVALAGDEIIGFLATQVRQHVASPQGMKLIDPYTPL
jgi:hypothetical protein